MSNRASAKVCCKRPAIATMDYTRQSPDRKRNGVAMVNRCCTNCWAHWFGPVGSVKTFTSKQWDEYVSRAA